MEGFKGAGLAQPPPRRRRQLCICMASDFFFPSLGGIETHIYNLSQCLIQRGFKVVVITHYAKKRYGVRYLSNGLKVYYLPFLPVANNATLPTFFAFFPLIRNILLRERVDIVHGHQSTSTLAHETLMIARALGMQVAYTDHSLFGFDDMACIHLNKIVRFSLHDLDACICVSHTHRENFVLRAGIHPSRVSVISNAVDASTLVPDPAKRPQPPQVRVVVLSRLAYRKGIDLLVTVIPPICKKLPHVNFVIGGDGPKRIILEEMREKHRLQDRVELIGAVSHDKVGALLQSGHIFLNTSLTESFCIAIVEAAACGMLVVSTNVGGIPEVLPPHMVLLCDPDDLQVQRRLAEAVAMVHTVDPFRFHREILQRYSWHDVAARVERVYFSLLFPETKVYPPCSASATPCLCGHSPLGPSEDDPREAAHFCVCARRTFWRDDARSISLEGEEDVTSSPRVDTRSFYEDSLCACCDKPPLCCGCLELPPSPPPLPSPFLVVQRLRKLYALGPVSGKIFCIVAIITWVYIRVLEFFYPSAEIEEVPAFPCDILLCLAEESGPEESENLANSESASQDQLH
ncbi:N-acetylglucosaminyl-phosphatidylinositol biosynthetic protein PigA, family GT4 protein [Besnoitia besnoiti]|uniref:phosphatidylinositol N-acetylglucosaminyltransferase n=1 Tax=Besnoitia besnoiti TaxID=94643 RepID=A0A2A9MLQ0_BESBE|nr:N-acetylglucosaminyl-phosphatidylinositol biosynthetic protein PigA, family GT4 protein [Besnoitia besnoiti]PFH36392.1 N-acetylglucosaminyl-phosphatidylinositol biosynthetic protein PigA, family GT4 protein [Besnoitia besnoiti]